MSKSQFDIRFDIQKFDSDADNFSQKQDRKIAIIPAKRALISLSRGILNDNIN